MFDNMPFLLELERGERLYIQELITRMSENQAERFTTEYRRKRKDPQSVLFAAVVGLIACPGLQRFWLGETGMGLLFLLTGGVLLMGSIIDLATYKSLALSYNRRVAHEIETEMQKFEATRSTTPLQEHKRRSSPLNREASVYGDLIIQ
jgi:TM2 domain-containing membrane protein YozV